MVIQELKGDKKKEKKRKKERKTTYIFKDSFYKPVRET